MGKIRTIFIYLINFIVGYLSVPFYILGFLLAMNSSKGWNVQNDDGKIFIPLGVMILLVFTVIAIANILKIINHYTERKVLDRFLNEYLKSTAYFIGIIIYLLWCVIQFFIKI